MVITGRAHCFNDSMYLYAHLGSVRFEHSECRGLLMTTYITLIALLVEYFLFHWYQQCITVRHVPEGTLLLWLHVYITPILLLWDLSTHVVDHLWASIYIYIWTYLFLKFSYLLRRWPWDNGFRLKVIYSLEVEKRKK